MLKSKSKYYYLQLDDSGKRVYNSILSAWEARNPNSSFRLNPPNAKTDIYKILTYISLDNPGLFYVDFTKIISASSSTSTTVQANFIYNERQITVLEKQLETVITKILTSRKFDTMDKYDKELTLHDYLVKNVSYVDDPNNDTTSIVAALISNRAVCDGYAKAFKLLCDQAGLSCIVVSGKATPLNMPEESHSWNIVKLNGVCSHVDVTWDSTTRGDNDTCYDHFNLTDKDMARDHTWDRSLLPPCISSPNNYYVRNGQCVSSRAEFKRYIISQLKKGKKTITLRLIGQERTQEQVMNAAMEALADAQRLGYSINLRYNQKRGTASISVARLSKSNQTCDMADNRWASDILIRLLNSIQKKLTVRKILV